MAENGNIVIIGAGFAGAATAWHLAMRGVTDVVLIEAEDGPGLHASGRNASLVFQLLKNADEARLVVEGARFYARPPRGFCDRPLFRPCGSLLLASRERAANLEEGARDAERLGLQAEIRTPAEVVRRVPLLRDSPVGLALENPTDGVVDIHNLLVGYLGGARLRGVGIRYGARVTAIAERGGRVVSVTAGGETIPARCVVNAAGAWAGEIGRIAGVGTRTIAPLRRHVFQSRADSRVDPSWPFVWHDDIDVYFRPEDGGLLLSACDAEPHPPADPAVDPAAEVELHARVARAFPRLAPVEIASTRACLRTFAADGRFVIGPDPDLGGFLWVAALGGHGMSTSYGVGRLGAAAALGERSAELDRYAPGRLGK